MDPHTATEIAYKNGYEAGRREGHPSGKWIIKEHIINEYGDTESSFVCSCCDKKYKCGEYTPKRFVEEHKFCPNCGAKMDNGVEEVVCVKENLANR